MKTFSKYPDSQDLLNDMESLESILPDNSITSHINAADAIQRSIDERDNESRSISDFSDWGEILNSILAEEEDCIEASSDERVLATATFASAMLHTDFEFEQVCEWLDDGSGDPTPLASSTLWVIELNGDLDRDEREEVAQGIRSFLRDSGSEGLDYGVISG